MLWKYNQFLRIYGVLFSVLSPSMSEEITKSSPQGNATEGSQATRKQIDVKLLDQQLADLDSDDLDSDDELHFGGCHCCAGLVGTINNMK